MVSWKSNNLTSLMHWKLKNSFVHDLCQSIIQVCGEQRDKAATMMRLTTGMATATTATTTQWERQQQMQQQQWEQHSWWKQQHGRGRWQWAAAKMHLLEIGIVHKVIRVCNNLKSCNKTRLFTPIDRFSFDNTNYHTQAYLPTQTYSIWTPTHTKTKADT